MMIMGQMLNRQSLMAYSLLKQSIEVINDEYFDFDDRNQDHQDKYLIENDRYLQNSWIKLIEMQNDLKHHYQHK